MVTFEYPEVSTANRRPAVLFAFVAVGNDARLIAVLSLPAESPLAPLANEYVVLPATRNVPAPTDAFVEPVPVLESGGTLLKFH